MAWYVTSSVDDRYQTSAMTASAAWCVTHKPCYLHLHKPVSHFISWEILEAWMTGMLWKAVTIGRCTVWYFLASSNHISLRVETEHPQVYKVVIEPEGWNEDQKVIESMPLPPGSTGPVTDKWEFPCIIGKNNIISNISSSIIKNKHREDGINLIVHPFQHSVGYRS